MNNKEIVTPSNREEFEHFYNYKKVDSCLRCKYFKINEDTPECMKMNKFKIRKIETYVGRICDLFVKSIK